MEASDLRAVTAFFGSSPAARLALIRAVWPQVVGQQVARQTEVTSLSGDFLRLRVADPRWRKVLPRMRADMLTRLRRALGVLAPRQIGLLEGVVQRAAALPMPSAQPAEQHGEAAAPRAHASPPDALVAAAGAIGDAALRAEFLAVAARYLAHAARHSAEERSI